MKIEKLEDCFDQYGSFIIRGFDPYCIDLDIGEDAKLYRYLFNESGAVHDHIQDELGILVGKMKWNWCCDAACVYHAHVHGSSTKGSYPAVYYWR